MTKIQFKDTKRFGIKFWPQKKLTRRQKDLYLVKNKQVLRKKSYKESYYSRKLLQKQKISLFYGKLSNHSFSFFLRNLYHLKGDRLKNFFLRMEKRLDLLTFRMKFFPTLGMARQMILHQKVLLNGQPLQFSQIQCKSGDIISLHPSVFNRVSDSIQNYLKSLGFLIYKKSFSRFSQKLANQDLQSIKKETSFLNKISKQSSQKIIQSQSSKGPGQVRLIKMNKLKLPHLEINYSTLTAVLLPSQSNFGFKPLFPLSSKPPFNIIRSSVK